MRIIRPAVSRSRVNSVVVERSDTPRSGRPINKDPCEGVAGDVIITSPLTRLGGERWGLLPQASRCALVLGISMTSRILRSDVSDASDAPSTRRGDMEIAPGGGRGAPLPPAICVCTATRCDYVSVLSLLTTPLTAGGNYRSIEQEWVNACQRCGFPSGRR
jgi:hypothetical protein